MKYAIKVGHEYRALRAAEIAETTGKPHLYLNNGRLLVAGRVYAKPDHFKAAIRYVIRTA